MSQLSITLTETMHSPRLKLFSACLHNSVVKNIAIIKTVE